MRIKRAILIPAILTFATAGSAVAGSALAVAPAASVVATAGAPHMAPNMYYNG